MDKVFTVILGVFFFILNLFASDAPDLDWIERTTELQLPKDFEVIHAEYKIGLREEVAHYKLLFSQTDCEEIEIRLNELIDLGDVYRFMWQKNDENYRYLEEDNGLYVDASFSLSSCMLEFQIQGY